MSKKLGVFIGRFQPFHLGHKHIINEALKHVDELLILVGSASSPRTYHNPFLFEERKRMIFESCKNDIRIHILPLDDSLYNDEQWIKRVQKIVEHFAYSFSFSGQFLAGQAPEIFLVGHQKDFTSYYLNLFPHWKSIPFANHNGINSTNIRQEYFELKEAGHPGMVVPSEVGKFLVEFQKTKDYLYLKEETDYITEYRNKWKDSPYPPTFVTVDACVIQSGHILLVRRRSAPGKGLWALPGGFLNQKERILDGMLRELKEETGLKVPVAVLKGNIKQIKVFDAVNRSSRGRVITHAHLIHLPVNNTLPKVKGMDDADKAKWYSLSNINEEMFFEDHWFIIQNLTASL